MSTGPEHYRAAESLLGIDYASEICPAAMAAAQVHATLALVAVIANTKALAEHPLVQRPDAYAGDGELTWKDVIQ